MTLEEAKAKIKIEKAETYPYYIIDNVDEVLTEVFEQKEKTLDDFSTEEILKHIGISEYYYNEYRD